MKKAAFYLLTETNNKVHYLCVSRLAEKAYQNKLQVYIYTNSNEESQTIDTQLWTFRDISFVPHMIYYPTSQLPSPLPEVLIGNVPPPSDYYKNNDENKYNMVLINLTTTIPDFVTNFHHIIEVIPNDENLKQVARTHYRHYQQQGYDVVTHNV